HQNLIVDVFVLEGDLAAQLVAEGGRAFGGDCHADDEGLIKSEICFDLLARQGAAGTGIAGRQLGGDLLFAGGVQLFGSAEAAVGGAVGQQNFGVVAVDFGAFGLAVGAIGAADVGAFVPAEAEPAQGVEDHLLGGGDE